MAPPNLTRADAERAPLCWRSPTYDVELDLTDGAGSPGETTFATRTTVRFTLPRARRATAGSTSSAPTSRRRR